MNALRWIVGRLILILNAVFAPKKAQHPAEHQAWLDQQTKTLALYEYEACPFCVKVRRTLRRQGLNIQTINAKQAEHKAELAKMGGKVQVPCLRIEENNQVQWLYESKSIIQYLEQRFA
ncbi:glutathione S-transferase N-terminal domain-containing protein [Deefgea piscis]|uniref:Glutathione S-transferase N-terminal domain-containing protein n=1 Tax=Deefgea piscis TaxID=2739061 RepID=A0A6M8STD5_9NEIS|nr:glutathione S-transferase N-terminal domain-containing protein [Deefgea piscis]QKJ67961.1 glutathione S-transferase N-terminal domain-containing protein [Deefgea piscis]